MASHDDQVAWSLVQPLAAWHKLVEYDECSTCVATHAAGGFEEPINCSRGLGTFLVAGFPLAALARDSLAAISRCALPLLKLAKVKKGIDAAFAVLHDSGRQPPEGCAQMLANAEAIWGREGAPNLARHASAKQRCSEQQHAACASQPPRSACGTIRSKEAALAAHRQRVGR